jgi:hypothetical protein
VSKNDGSRTASRCRSLVAVDASTDVRFRGAREDYVDNDDDVDRLLGLVERLASVEGGEALPSCSDAYRGLFGHWQQLIDGLDAWSCRHLARLAELEVGVADGIRGNRLVHFDLRSDNVIFATA